jgi:hypothetical protein
MVFHTAKSVSGWRPYIHVGEISTAYDSVSIATPTNIDSDTVDNDWDLDFLGGVGNAGKFVFMRKTSTSPNPVTGYIGQIATTYDNLTADNFIGISDAAYADGATATIQVITATDDAQSGLTAGSKHYVQNGGSLSTTADDPSVYAGIAISSTSILIKE